MSHDFAKKETKKRGSKKTAHKNTRKPTEKKSLPSWLLFSAGVISTLFVQLIIHLAQIDTGVVDDAISQKNPASKKTAAKEAKPKKPIYRFYDELKTQRVEVDTKEVEKREQEDYNYALQAGSFKKRDDAESLRAEIILLGLDAEIENKTSSSGSIRYRVIVGPFTSRSKLHSARNTLINNRIETLTIKRS